MTPPPDREAAIASFWAWWAEASPALVAQLGGERAARDAAAHAIGERLVGIGLRPTVMPSAAGSVIVGSADNDPPTRRFAEQWRAAAPSTDGVRFATHRPRATERALEQTRWATTPATTIAAMRFSVSWREQSLTADLDIWPGATLSKDDAGQVAVLSVEAILGEQMANCWFRGLKLLDAPPADGLDALAVRTAFDAKAAEWAAPKWQMLHVNPDPETNLVVTLRKPLHPAAHPHCDTYLGLLAEIDGTDLARARALEDQLFAEVPVDQPGGPLVAGAIAQYGGRETMLYVDPDHPSTALLRERATALGYAALNEQHDPGWELALQYQQPDPVVPPTTRKRRWFGRA